MERRSSLEDKRGGFSCRESGGVNFDRATVILTLYIALAAIRAATAGELAFVMGLAVIAGQLFPRPYLAQRVKFQPPAKDAHVGVWRAGMIDVPEMISSARGVYGRAVAKLDNHNRAGAASSSPGLRLFDTVSVELPHFTARRDGGARKQAPAMNTALLYLELIVAHNYDFNSD